MPFEGKKFEFGEREPTPPEEEKEEVEGKIEKEIEEEKLEEAPEEKIEEKPEKVEIEKEEKISPEEEICREYRKIEGKLEKEENKMKNPLKEKILKEFEETDPKAPREMIQKLGREIEDFETHIKYLKANRDRYEAKKDRDWVAEAQYRCFQGEIDESEKEKEEIENVIKAFESENPEPLKNLTEKKLSQILKKNGKEKKDL